MIGSRSNVTNCVCQLFFIADAHKMDGVDCKHHIGDVEYLGWNPSKADIQMN